MENGRNGQAAQAEEKPEKRMEAMPAEQAEKPEAEKKPGYPMHKRRYTPLYTIIVFLYGILVKLHDIGVTEGVLFYMSNFPMSRRICAPSK